MRHEQVAETDLKLDNLERERHKFSYRCYFWFKLYSFEVGLYKCARKYYGSKMKFEFKSHKNSDSARFVVFKNFCLTYLVFFYKLIC